MPDRDVKTIRDLIYYQYAKNIARRAFSAPDGKEAKKKHYGFVKEIAAAFGLAMTTEWIPACAGMTKDNRNDVVI